MPIPLKFLYIAAELAKDERTQKTAKAAWQLGSDAIQKMSQKRAAKAEVPQIEQDPPELKAKKKAKPGWRGKLDRKLRFRNGQSGDLIRFTFTDAHGLSSVRMVGNWECRGGELVGYCLNQKQQIGFDVDGISDWEEIPVKGEL